MFKKKKFNSQPIEMEEIFLDDFLRNKKKDFEMLDRKVEFPLGERIFYSFFIIAVICFLFLIALTFKLNVLNYKKYNELALANKFLNLKISSERGVIYDSQMRQLVFNEPFFEIFFDKNKDITENVIKEISNVIKIPPQTLKEKIDESSERFVLLSNNISQEQLIVLEAKKDNLQGVVIKKINKRRYIQGENLSHILGYTGRISLKELNEFEDKYDLTDYVGKEGLEKEYEGFLAEKKGILKIERDVHGKQISKKIEQAPASGKSLVLNIDLSLQEKISETLKDIINRRIGTAAAAVALNPKNGDVLALVSLPSFDNNLFSGGISQADLNRLNNNPHKPQLNRVIGGVYSIGSTIKPIISIAALEEGIITETTRLFCPKKLCLENRFSKQLECFADWKFHGWADVKRAIAESINPFFYMIGGGYTSPSSADPRLPKYFKGLGIDKIDEWLSKFNFGNYTNIDLPGEVKGRVPSPEWKQKYFSNQKPVFQKWYQGDTYNLSIGQGYILVSPMQLAVAYQAIANQGKIFKPHIVKKILSNKDEIIKPEIIKQISLDSKNISIVRQGMREAVSSPAGSAHALNSLPVKVAAKTGTAQIPKKGIYNNWIVVFGPYEDPEIILVILVEKVKGLQAVVQPAAYNILQHYFSPKTLDK